jgi:hypothetical protein
MNRDELFELCDRYVRRRGLGTLHVSAATMPPVLEIVDSFLHAEISESEKNSLLAYVRGPDHDDEEQDVGFGDEADLARIDDSGD